MLALRAVQFKFLEPEETGGRSILNYVLEMAPPPLGWEGAPNAEVGEMARWAGRCGDLEQEASDRSGTCLPLTTYVRGFVRPRDGLTYHRYIRVIL